MHTGTPLRAGGIPRRTPRVELAQYLEIPTEDVIAGLDAALALRLESDMKQTEIAAELGCSQMQVPRLLARAAGKLHALTDPRIVSAV